MFVQKTFSWVYFQGGRDLKHGRAYFGSNLASVNSIRYDKNKCNFRLGFLTLLPTGGIFIPHHHNISCHSETT